jgi:hypothetical protein
MTPSTIVVDLVRIPSNCPLEMNAKTNVEFIHYGTIVEVSIKELLWWSRGRYEIYQNFTQFKPTTSIKIWIGMQDRKRVYVTPGELAARIVKYEQEHDTKIKLMQSLQTIAREEIGLFQRGETAGDLTSLWIAAKEILSVSEEIN